MQAVRRTEQTCELRKKATPFRDASALTQCEAEAEQGGWPQAKIKEKKHLVGHKPKKIRIA